MSSVVVTSNVIKVKHELDTALRSAMETVGQAAVDNAQDICPVDTSNLKNSITHRVVQEDATAKSITAEVGTPVYYAPYVELGHSQQPGRFVPKLGKRLKASWVEARPFLRPAIENNMDEYNQIIESALGN